MQGNSGFSKIIRSKPQQGKKEPAYAGKQWQRTDNKRTYSQS